ncbi:MAG: hypothetical protein ACR2F6_17115 [Mycobacteriales bacterium]
MAGGFGEDAQPLPADYLGDLLSRAGFWALAAFLGPEIVGGLTAHALPMTRSPSAELFIYDLAVERRNDQSLLCGIPNAPVPAPITTAGAISPATSSAPAQASHHR